MAPTDIASGQGTRRFGRINWLGLFTLSEREIQRFMAVWTQTLLAPLATAALFLAVFTLAIGQNRGPIMGVSFTEFLAPGLLMMTVIQNAFANTSSSIMISKVQGNIVDTLMPPLSAGELMLGYLAGALARGLLVAVVIALGLVLVLGHGLAHPLWLLAFVTVGSLFLGAVGVVAAIWSNKFDQIAAITNFVVTPLAFLSGTFYAQDALPEAMRIASHVNPVFYLIDGARYGMIGASDSSPVLGLGLTTAATLAVSAVGWWWLRTGYRLKA
jgi:ABC-2 type transport system permease protein